MSSKPLRLVLPFCTFALSLAAHSSSFVVLQDSQPGLFRVFADGKVETIAEGVQGIGLAVDVAGNYIVTTGAALLRVTPTGTVSTIATAPNGANWVAVAADQNGNVIAADEPGHLIWRIPADGQVAKVAKYPGSLPIGGSDLGLVIDPAGDYLVMRAGDHNVPELYRITPAGAVSSVALNGAIAQPNRRLRVSHGGALAVTGGPLVSDRSGGYYFLDDSSTHNLFHITGTGRVTRLTTLTTQQCCVRGLARDPETGDLIVGERSRLVKVARDGSVSDLTLVDRRFLSISAIVVDPVTGRVAQ